MAGDGPDLGARVARCAAGPAHVLVRADEDEPGTEGVADSRAIPLIFFRKVAGIRRGASSYL